MKSIALSTLLVTLCALSPASRSAEERPSLDCSVGPVPRTYAHAPWLIYSCSDGKSIVVVADVGNPAQPFFFIVFPEEDSIRVYGEGTGKKSATHAAFNQLKKLTSVDLAAIVIETRTAVPTPAEP